MEKMPLPPMGMVGWECLIPGVAQVPRPWLDTVLADQRPPVLMPESGASFNYNRDGNFSFLAVVDQVEVHFKAQVPEEELSNLLQMETLSLMEVL